MATDKIQLYSVGTPNGQKIGIALEELGVPYEAHTVDIRKGDQFKPDFLKINPNGKIPAIVDPNGPDGKPISIFESGAILLYLAEKYGKLLPKDKRQATEVVQWLMWQMGGLGPITGQLFHFSIHAPEKIPYGIERYTKEVKRLLGVLDRQLKGHTYIVGDEFTIADAACYGWVNTLKNLSGEAVGFSDFAEVSAWLDRCASRPGVQAGVKVTPFPS